LNRIGCIVLILIAVVVGYDQWRIEQMRGEIKRLSGRVHSVRDKVGKTDSDLVSSLAAAQKHAMKAKKLLAEKNTAAAQAELDRVLSSLKSANAVSRDIAGDAAVFLGEARERAVDLFQKAWNDISREAKPAKQ